MTLPNGTRLGPYEIVAPLGAGGMGEVYRALDVRLNRTVAVKILPDSLAADAQFRERFDREARAISQLNHPNVCAVYDVGEVPSPDPHAANLRYLVMEYLAGETLEKKLASTAGRGLSLSDALTIGTQIASALAAAHGAGIVHRDLKPANIMLTRAGAKLLDFGLAKATTPIGAATGYSMLPTTPPSLTVAGAILGTFQYMAPEQLEGEEADARTDIFAFGLVLYEMLTGRKAFAGKSQASLISAIMSAEPASIASVQPLTPPALEHVVRTCLAKDPQNRFHSAHDVVVQLRWIAESPVTSPPAAMPQIAARRRWTRAALIATVIALSSGVTAAIVWNVRRNPAAGDIRRFAIDLAEDEQFTSTGRRNIALSPDGKHLAYGANGLLYLRRLDELTARPIGGTVAANSPFFSPDGKWIAFFQGGKLKKMALTGGAPLEICDASSPFGTFWSSDGTILFGQNPGGILRVPDKAGAPETIIKIDAAAGEVAFGPQVLAGGRAVLFTLLEGRESKGTDPRWDDAQIVVQALDSGQRSVLVRGGTAGQYVPTGHLLYVRQGTLFAMPFDEQQLAATGTPVPILSGLAQSRQAAAGGISPGNTNGLTGAAMLAVSGDGMLAYVEGSNSNPDRSLVWVDRQGRESPIDAEPRLYSYPRISPDGRHLALDIRDQERDIWIWNFDGRTLTKLTFDPETDVGPVWSPDGKRIAYFTNGKGLRWQAEDGTGSVETLTTTGANIHQPANFTPDGKSIIIVDSTGSNPTVDRDVKILHIGDGKLEPLLADPKFSEDNPQLSPDGRWLAYQSNESNRNEVYVRPFPEVQAGHWRISHEGGTRPAWSRDGRELFFLASPSGASNVGNVAPTVPVTMMSASVHPSPTFHTDNPIKLFSGLYFAGLSGLTYDVSRGGEKFLMIKPVATAATQRPRILVVENWFEELNKLVPHAK